MNASGSLLRFSIFGLVLGLAAVGIAPPAQAAPDVSGSTIIDEPNGAPPFCTQPCYSVEKHYEVYNPGNATVPAGPGCPATDYTYIYTLTHIGGMGPFVPSVTAFEQQVAAADVTSAGFIPGPDVSPSSVTIQALAVLWDFPAPGAIGPAASGGAGFVSDPLFVCSPLSPGGVTDTMISFDGTLALDAPGTCVGPKFPPVVACDLDLDKTCCIPQPAVPNGDLCEGSITELVLEYTGDDCGASNNTQGKKTRCSGGAPGDPVSIVYTGSGNPSVVPSTNINVGDTVTITGNVGQDAKFNVVGPDDTQSIKIHTSCSAAIRCGDQFGSMQIIGATSSEGGPFACPAPPDPGEDTTACTAPGLPAGTNACEDAGPGKFIEVVFEYNGADCADPLANPQGGNASCDGDATGATDVGMIYTGAHPSDITVSPASMINDGDLVRVTATGRDVLSGQTKLQIVDNNSVEQAVSIHTSCSQPLNLGDVFGSLTVVGYTHETNGMAELEDPGAPIFQQSCEVPLAPPSPHCTSKVISLTLAYIGDTFGFGCDVTNPQGNFGSCTGVDDPGAPASVTITKDAGSVMATPNSGIDLFDLVEITDTDNELNPNTEFDVSGPGGSQSITMRTNCSKQLNLGDVFGSFVVFGLDRLSDGPVSLGGVVEYQYKVTNPSLTDTVDNVEVTDDQVMGPIASGLSIPPGGMVTLFDTRTLFTTTTNHATATGDVMGSECTEGTDEVTATVLAPPAGPYSCEAPMKRLAMVWDGAQDVRVVAWKGAVGSLQLADVPLVAPGDVVEVGGFVTAPSDVIWEIFEPAPSWTKLGESTFHLSCSDPEMNGVEDCGKREGDGPADNPANINDWLLEEITDSGGRLDCTPDPIVVNQGSCGIGFELGFLLPPLMWAWTRRRRRTLG